MANSEDSREWIPDFACFSHTLDIGNGFCKRALRIPADHHRIEDFAIWSDHDDARAKEAGVNAMMLTVDGSIFDGNRERDRRIGFSIQVS